MKLENDTVTFTENADDYRRARQITDRDLLARGMSAHNVLELRALGDEARVRRLVEMMLEERAEFYLRMSGDDADDIRVRVDATVRGQD